MQFHYLDASSTESNQEFQIREDNHAEENLLQIDAVINSENNNN